MDWYFFVKTLHIISSTILFGTGIGIAFFMFRSRFTKNLHEKLYASKNTVLADYIFTLPAVIIQPLTGFMLIQMAGYSWDDFWLVATYCLYIIAGLCWIPVVWIQIQLKNIVVAAIHSGMDVPERYNHLFKIWLLLGCPAFAGLVVVFFLMVLKPI